MNGDDHINAAQPRAETETIDKEAMTSRRIKPTIDERGEAQSVVTSSLDSGMVSWEQSGVGAITRTVEAKLREIVSAADYGLHPDNTAAENLAAIEAAMTHLLDRFPNDTSYYPGGPGDPTDFYATNRQTGEIHIPAGRYFVPPQLFSNLTNGRAPFCGFEFVGAGKMSSILLLETGGTEAWFYNNGELDKNKFQQIHWRNLGFRSDDYRYGNVAKIWSEGGPKQFRWTDCDFQYLQRLIYTEGTGNADLSKITRCTGMFYGDILTLDNDQSVQHDFIGSDFGTYGHCVRVKRHGGGNVNIINASIDFIWHENYSPAGGNFMFYEESDASIGQGNCTFTFRDCRVEVEAYRSTAGAPPFGIVKTAAYPNNACSRVLFQNINFVNGQTYTIDGGGNITGSAYRRITGVDLYPRKHVVFEDCVLLKCFFYNITGDRDTGSPNIGGILHFTRCFDGIVGELPPADTAKQMLHSRVTYSGSAGRVITRDMVEHTTGSSFIRKLNDADPNFRRSFGREPSSHRRICHFKHINNGWPFAANASNDHFLDIPPGFTPLRVFVNKLVLSGEGNSYQLHLKANDRSGATIASSSFATFRDAHVIELSHVDWSAYSRICLCASGTGTDFDNGGWAYVEYAG